MTRSRGLNRWLAPAFVIALGMAATTAHASNVIVNGTFDNNTTGWTGTYYVVSGDSYYPSFPTEPYFFAGDTVAGSTVQIITQTYNLTAADLATLAGPGLDYTMQGDLFNDNFSDHATFSVDFLDGSNTSLGQESLVGLSVAGPPNLHIHQMTTGSLPTDTASLLFAVSVYRSTAQPNNGYADNLVFDLSSATVSTTPLPAGLPLFLTGAGLFGVLAQRRKKSKGISALVPA